MLNEETQSLCTVRHLQPASMPAQVASSMAAHASCVSLLVAPHVDSCQSIAGASRHIPSCHLGPRCLVLLQLATALPWTSLLPQMRLMRTQAAWRLGPGSHIPCSGTSGASNRGWYPEVPPTTPHQAWRGPCAGNTSPLSHSAAASAGV